MSLSFDWFWSKSTKFIHLLRIVLDYINLMCIFSIDLNHWSSWIFLCFLPVSVCNMGLDSCKHCFVSVTVARKNACERISHFHFAIKCSC